MAAESGSVNERWEYRTLRYVTGSEFEELAEPQLNELGADGWDVVGFARFQHKNENGYRVILKRSL